MRKAFRLGQTVRAVLLTLATFATLGQYNVSNRLAFRYMSEEIRKIPERCYRDAVARMCRDGLLSLKRNGEVDELSLTPKGNRILIAKGLGIKGSQRKSAGTEHTLLVSFDVPERIRARRALLRIGLEAIGYLPVQQSLYELPGGDPSSVRELATSLNIAKYVRTYRVVPVK